ncbi:hypothetical protein [Nonomuraea sp. NPDC049725]|uniref:hypothetical protein n=1 Tax=Nonomuraea sp. NPDC049725 TaxID=3154508 RepID=UPI00342BCDED
MILSSRPVRFPVALLTALLMLTACSERVRGASVPAEKSPSARPLVDLRKEVKRKGKVLLHHIAKSGETDWTGELKVGNSYKLAVDCTGSWGELAIALSESFRTTRRCSAGYTTFTLDNYPAKKPRPRTLTIKAPPDARWTVMVAGIYQGKK